MKPTLVLAASAVAVASLGASGTSWAQPVDAVAAVARACAEGPDAVAARAIRARGSAEVDVAAVLPNPSLVVQHQQTLDGPGERETVLGVSVPLGIGGRRWVLQDDAEARSEAARAGGDARLFASSLDLREATAVAALDAARVAVLAEQQRVLDEIGTTLEGLARGGEVARHDRSRHRTQARLHQNQLTDAEAQAAASRAVVEVWLGGPVEITLGSSALFVAPVPPAGGAAEPSTSEVRALLAEDRALGLEAEAAGRGWVPDLEVFAGYRNVDASGATGHGLSLSLTVPLTFFDHGQGEVTRAQASQLLVRAEVDHARYRLDAAARGARARLERLGPSLARAAAEEAESAAVLQETRTLYAAGEVSLTDVFDVFRAAEEARLAHLDRLTAVAAARLALMRAVGSHFDPTLDRACGGQARGASR